MTKDEGPVRIVLTGDGAAVRGRTYDASEGVQRQVLEDLYEMAWHLREVEKAREAAVIDARRLGLSWHSIGMTYGVTGEAARRRFAVACEVAGAGSDD